jgi:hypothetical protein
LQARHPSKEEINAAYYSDIVLVTVSSQYCDHELVSF